MRLSGFFWGWRLPVILDAHRTCKYPYVDSHSSLRKYYKILPFGVHQGLPFQNLNGVLRITRTSTVFVFFFKILP
jgi:hypothetical protein